MIYNRRGGGGGGGGGGFIFIGEKERAIPTSNRRGIAYFLKTNSSHFLFFSSWRFVVAIGIDQFRF